MATDRNVLKQWFVRGAKPLSAQFGALIDSFVHKDDTISASRIEGLQAAMDEKVNQQVVQGVADELEAHKTDTMAHASLREAMDAEAAARENGDEDTLEAATDAISTHNVSPDAHVDIRQEIANANTKIKALQGIGGYLTAYDFGVAMPAQQDFTDYALVQIGIAEPLDIFNGTRVKNTHDNHVWILTNTSETDPPVFQWMDNGEDVVDVPGSSISDISADADDTVIVSGTLVNLLKSISGRVKALLNRFHTSTGHNHDGSNSRKITYDDITGTPSSLPADGGNADTVEGMTVAQILTGAVFTFIINSNEALAAWANNAAGNNYTSVLIKPGTWMSNAEVNLTNAGTKVVVGMPGSLLSFTPQYGMVYNSVPTTPDYWMHGVNIELTNHNEEGGEFSVCFNNCINLKNCYGKADANAGIAFLFCDNLADCHGLGISESDEIGIGFAFCNKLINCAGSGTGSEKGVGFYGCGMMMFNEPASTIPSTMGTYMNCYMEYTDLKSNTDNYTPVSYSAEGGWNRGEIVE